MPVFIPLNELPDQVGRELPPSDWFKVTQSRINRFADATNDRQFIHVDPIKAVLTPFRGTIAHGFLSLSLLTHLNEQRMLVPEGTRMLVNYGANRLRFIAPVRRGKRIRSHQKILAVVEKNPGQWLVTIDVRVEIEGEAKPALVAEMLALFIVKGG